MQGASGLGSKTHFFYVRVTHPSASLLWRAEALAQLSRNEKQKKCAYLERVVNVERGAFTPLVFATDGMYGQECSRALRNLVGIIVDNHSDLQQSIRLLCDLCPI